MKHRKGLTWLTELPIAHRGLHDTSRHRPENSMAAFRAAVEAPYAIECDLHPSADGVPIVFHDDDLARLTGIQGNIRDRTASELQTFSLGGSEERIPALADLLTLVAGAVPLILELKSQAYRDDGFAEAVCELLADYAGPVAVMSFEPRLIRDTRLHAPGLPRGLVAHGGWRSCLRFVAAVVRVNAHFVSYSIDDLPTPGPLIARYGLGLPLICWTIRNKAQQRHADRWTEQITFEGFLPCQSHCSAGGQD